MCGFSFFFFFFGNSLLSGFRTHFAQNIIYQRVLVYMARGCTHNFFLAILFRSKREMRFSARKLCTHKILNWFSNNYSFSLSRILNSSKITSFFGRKKNNSRWLDISATAKSTTHQQRKEQRTQMDRVYAHTNTHAKFKRTHAHIHVYPIENVRELW